MIFSYKDLFLNLIASKQRRLPWDFNSSFYQFLYPDVTVSGLKPRKHYRKVGQKEGRLYKETTFLKKDLLNPNLETIVFCFDDERSSVFTFIDTLKHISQQFNIIVVSNVQPAKETKLQYCDWFIINKIFDRSHSYAKNLIQIIKEAPNLKFVISNIYEDGFFYQRLEKAGIANILTIDGRSTFGFSNLSRGLRYATRVVYADEIYAEKILYDYMYGYPDKLHILNSALFNVPFNGEVDNPKTIIGFGDISFMDGFDIFANIAYSYELLHPESDIQFIWIKASTSATSFDGFEQSQDWQRIQRDHKNIRVVLPNSNIEDYYQKTAIFFDTSRFSNKLSHSRCALMAGKPVFSRKFTEPLSSLFQKNQLDDLYLLAPGEYGDFIQKLNKVLQSDKPIDADKFVKIANEIGTADQFIKNLLQIGNEAHQQIKQEQIDAKELLNKEEFDCNFWSGDNSKEMSLNVAQKYIRSWKSGVFPRRPCAGFQPGIYAEYNDLGIERKDPFLHYLDNGKPNGPWRWDILKDTVNISDGALNQKIALQIHAYFIDKLTPMIDALLTNKIKPDLFISVKNNDDKLLAEKLLENYPSKVEVLISPNKGRDIGPLLTLFRDQLRHGYDIIGHMHTKHSGHISDRNYAAQWEQYLITNLLGDRHNINAADTIIEEFYKDKSVNLIFPDDRNAVSWVKNRHEAQKIAPLLGIDKLPNYVNFPVGTMFWARKDLLQPFFDLNLDWTDYLREPLPLDGTNLHAIERLFGVVNQKISKRLVCTMFGNLKR